MISNLTEYRQNFPALANKSYFNYGGQGTLPKALVAAYENMEKLGPFSGAVNDFINEEESLIKNLIALELQGTPETITLTENVTVGCNIALWGIDWKPGDNLIISDCEHQGVIGAVQELERRYQIEVTICPLMATLNEGDAVRVIAESLTAKTRLLVVSHILWNTGQILPLGEIIKVCHEKNVKVLVDAAQSVGVLPLNMVELGVDFYAFTGHKWWCGPCGLGGLYISKEAQETLHPTFIGWRGVVKNKLGYPRGLINDGRRYEVGTSAYPLYAGLRKAIELHHLWGKGWERYQKIREKSQILWELLNEIDGIECLKKTPPESGLISFKLTRGKSPRELVINLEKQGIILRTILNPDCVRACVHYFTEEREMAQLVSSINEYVK
jgi:L-cysteine/cystine lyase